MEIKTVGVVGCGTMGSGICEVAARAGYQVIFREVDEERVAVGIDRIDHSLARAERSGKLTADERKETLARITGVVELEGLAPADLVVEAVPEFLEYKKETFATLDRILPEHAILATNTSSLPVIELGVATHRPESVVGIHFFNPPPIMKLVELVRTITSSQQTVERARVFVESLGKTAVVCRDRAGFIANLLLFPYLNEAVKLLEGGFATREDIDDAMKLGAGHPMGPLALLDLVGLDSCAEILESLYRQFPEIRFAPSPAFRHLVAAGYNGRKSGKGIYTYEEPGSPKVVPDDRSGQVVPLPEGTREISRVAVIGTGTMAAGIAQVAAAAGFEVVGVGRSDESLARARVEIEKSCEASVAKEKMTEQDASALSAKISWTLDTDAVAGCGLIIEAIAENLALKKQVFAELDKAADPDAILATCTSSLPVVEVAAATSRPEKVIGMHFFNPATRMPLVEIVRTVATSAEALAIGRAAAERMGKHPVFCLDRAGFIVNRLLFPYLNDAVKMIEEGYATKEEIDTAMKLGCRHPMGPLELVDLVGLDVTFEILTSLHDEFREPAFTPAPLLGYMVAAGYLGRKKSHGFYTY